MDDTWSKVDFKSVLTQTRINWKLLGLIVLLTLIGLVSLYSATYAQGIFYHDDGFYFLRTQVKAAAIGIVFMIIISYFPYYLLHKLAWPAYILTLILLVIPLISSDSEFNRWLDLGFLSFQPSELMKIVIVILFAHLASKRPELMSGYKYGCRLFIFTLAPAAALVLAEPHMSATAIICALGMACMFFGGTKVKYLLAIMLVVLLIFLLVMNFSDKLSYTKERAEKLQEDESSEENYQTYQSLIAIGSGGVFGLGISKSRQKMNYLPELENDFIFSVVIEEVGFVGAALILFVFLFLVCLGSRVAQKAKDKFGEIMAAGISTHLAIQVILNMLVITNTFFNTGVSLPFFSQGGTALVMMLAEMGLLLSIDRYTHFYYGEDEQ